MPLIGVTNMIAAGRWSPWRAFPDPRERAYLYAPFGPGVYELRHTQTGKLVLFGSGKNLAHRMASLLPKPHGAGHRSNTDKQEFVLTHLTTIEYRTKACTSDTQARKEERKLRITNSYIFQT